MKNFVLRVSLGLWWGISISAFAIGETGVAGAPDLPENVRACLVGMRGTPPTSVAAARYTLGAGRSVNVISRDYFDGVLFTRRTAYTMTHVGEVTHAGRACTKCLYTGAGIEMNRDRPLAPGESRASRDRADAQTLRETRGQQFPVYTAIEGTRHFQWDAEHGWRSNVQPEMQDGVSWATPGGATGDSGERGVSVWRWVGDFTSPVTGTVYREVFALVTTTASTHYAAFYAPELGIVYATLVARDRGSNYRSEMWVE